MVEWIPICSVNENNLTVPYVKVLYQALSERLPWMSFVVDDSLDDKTLLTMAWQRVESVQKTHQTMLVPHWLQLAQPAAPAAPAPPTASANSFALGDLLSATSTSTNTSASHVPFYLRQQQTQPFQNTVGGGGVFVPQYQNAQQSTRQPQQQLHIQQQLYHQYQSHQQQQQQQKQQNPNQIFDENSLMTPNAATQRKFTHNNSRRKPKPFPKLQIASFEDEIYKLFEKSPIIGIDAPTGKVFLFLFQIF